MKTIDSIASEDTCIETHKKMISRGKLAYIIRTFNQHRYPEAWAKVVWNKPPFLMVKFGGTAAVTSCCFDEHFVDFSYHLLDYAGVEAEIVKVKRVNEGMFEVKYKLDLHSSDFRE